MRLRIASRLDRSRRTSGRVGHPVQRHSQKRQLGSESAAARPITTTEQLDVSQDEMKPAIPFGRSPCLCDVNEDDVSHWDSWKVHHPRPSG